MDTVKERLTAFITHKGISASEFCRNIGVSAAFVSSIRKSIQPDKVESIALNYPELNTGWLLTGNGEMLNVPSAGSTSASESNVLRIDKRVWSVLLRQIESLERKDRQIDELITLLKGQK